MLNLRLTAFAIVCAGLQLACATKVGGTYTLDLEETKRSVERAAAEHPEFATNKQPSLKMLDDTLLLIDLDEGGKMRVSTTTTLSDKQKHTETQQGSWKRDGSKVSLQVELEAATQCEVDGKRLRCFNDALQTLLAHYVLVQK